MRSGVFASNPRSHLPHNLITTFVLIALSGLISLGSTVVISSVFTHPSIHPSISRDIVFALVVDDFGVKYHQRQDFDFLVSTLSLLYHAKAHPISTKFLGFSLHHNRSLKTLSLSYPGYISTLLTRLRPNGVRPASSPSIYTPPSLVPEPPSPPLALTLPPQPPRPNPKSCR